MADVVACDAHGAAVREKFRLKRWQVVCASVVGIAGIAFAGGGAAGTWISKHQSLTEEQLRQILDEKLKPMDNEINALKTRSALVEAQVAAINAQVLPRLAQIDDKLSRVAEDMARVRGRLGQ